MSAARAVLLVFPMLCGCETPHRLVPAPEARLAGDERRAVGESAGVRLVAEVDAWSGDPPNLDEAVTPLHVSIANDSDHALRLRYNELVLAGPALDRAPLPAFRLVDRELIVADPDPLLVPRFAHSGFFVAPYYPSALVGLEPWYAPWDVDRDFYVRQYPKWRVSLPSVDMIEEALPEGVIAPGGRIEGFVYYERLDPQLDEVSLELDLIDANTELAFGRSIRIAFRVL